MDPSAFAAALTMQSGSPSRGLPSQDSRPPTLEELDVIDIADYGNLQGNSSSDASYGRRPTSSFAGCTGTQKNQSSQDPEASQPSTPQDRNFAVVVPSFSFPAKNKWRVLAACLIYFGNGMNDSAPGALIPYIEDYYNIGYAVVSLIWVTNAVGFILAAFFADVLRERYGRATTLMGSECSMIAGYIIAACSPPFPAVVIAYLLLGFGNAINLAMNNVFCGNLANPTIILGAAHGSYGIGGILGPIVATALASNGILWSRFYLVTIGVRLTCFAFGGWAFWGLETEPTSHFHHSSNDVSDEQSGADIRQTSKMRLLGRALQNRITLIGALFIFTYQGAEVAESGWFISYLIDYRNGNPQKVGYVTAGFWAGITVGRFVITHASRKVGEKKLVFGLGAGVLIFQLMSWLIPDVIGNAVAVAIVGLLLGPVCPCAWSLFNHLLTPNIQTTSVGFISSAGSSGGAIVPLITGLLAQTEGTYVLHPVCIASFVVMLICWAGMPRVGKRKE
ncbi:MFS general substrate transporter [Hortaea werneckii]|uniref:Major facilitator superfamily (MFS) profile domain-containing protein n=1 Tax=Hortaea werneckii TaxID=91943 RepID=A0A3M7EBU8_HORWE|nr:MFS general substrate transporter [Hortaea werneckii]KAI7603238.1 MFS general substrate transporter [Hortaea werneckii]KAI7605005.1 MFS general substrate transporter [Hortaea werneckii]KAI7650505.1 MFS general substrate transporter [Hortaea werneckii]RMY73616.1 hypothetical protein D0864_10183 [Hortaea werneckii]